MNLYEKVKVVLVWSDVYCENHDDIFEVSRCDVPAFLEFRMKFLRENRDFLHFSGISVEAV